MKYEKPEMRMFEFEVEDIITTSSNTTTTTTAPTTTTPVNVYDGNFDIFVL